MFFLGAFLNGRGSSPASSLDRVSPLLTSYGLESVKTSMQSAQQPPPPQQMEYMTMPPLDYGMDMMMVHNQAAAAQHAAAAHQQPPGPPPVQQPPHGQPPHHQVPPQMVASAQPYIPSQYMTGHYAVVPASSGTGQGGPHAGQAGPFVSTNNYVTSNSLQHVNHPQLAAAAASHMQYGQQPYVHQPVVSQGNSFVPNTGKLTYT